MRYLLLLLSLAQDLPTFRSDVTLVHMDAEVRREDRPIDGLRREDFRVTDGGKPQTVLYFGQQEEPVSVILLFDTSVSMAPSVARVAEAAHTAMRALRPGDRIAVMAFDCATNLITDFTGDLAAVERGIRDGVLRRRFGGCSPIQPALAAAAQRFLKEPRSMARRAVIIITDDRGTERRPGAVRDLWEADAAVFGVIVGTGGSLHIGPPSSYGYKGMRDIAAKTGGDTLKTGDPAETLHEMIRRLRSRYSLYYALPQAAHGEVRKTRVQLTKDATDRYPGAVVRARTGYVVPDARH